MLDNLAGVLVGKYHTDVLVIDLPLVTESKTIRLGTSKYGRRILEKSERTFGEFCFTGDHHYGSRVFSEPVMHGYLNFLRQHTNIGIGIMGDILNCGRLSKFIADETVLDIDEQIAEFCNDWRPLKDRINFALWGNHEEREARAGKNNLFMKTIFRTELEAQNTTIAKPERGLFVVFKAGEQSYGCYVQHSRTNARVNQDLQLRRSGSQNVVSIIAHGHTHRLSWKPRTFLELSNVDGDLYTLVRRQYLLATGCFLEYPPYAEARSMPLAECGAPIVRFYADKRELGYYDLTMTYHDYLQYDSAGAGTEHYDHDRQGLRQSYRNPFEVKRGCLL
jgi:hypothetical protein